MQVEKLIITKAKWSLYLDPAKMPHLGFYADGVPCSVAVTNREELPPGVNVVMRGAMLLCGTSRGRSAAEFSFVSPNGWYATTSLTGTELLIKMAAKGQMALHHDAWEVPGMGYDTSIREVSGAVFDGYWTVAKQGTSVTILPVSEEFVKTAKPY